MKNNLKTKVMLAVLAGNMFCMGNAFAISSGWYGTKDGFVGVEPDPAVTSGVNLTITDTTENIDDRPENRYTADGADFIYGGYIDGSEEVKNNSITFNTTQASTIYATICGGQSESGNVANNSVTIEDGTFSGNIYGGHGGGIAGGDTPEKGNKVIIKNGTFSGSIYGGWSVGNVQNNSVIINSGTFKSGVEICGGCSNFGGAKGNKVTIEGGTFENGVRIYGGCGGFGEIQNNTVTINGGIFENGFELCGGQMGVKSSSSGNILNLKTKIGGKANKVNYFQKMNFTIPANMDKEMAMLNVTTPVVLHDDTNGDIAFTTNLNGMTLAEGDYITLIKNVNNTDFTLATSGLGHYVLTIGSGATEYKELVYSNGTPIVKGDYTIRQGGVKGESEITGSYTSTIKGNTDGTGLTVTGGSLSSTSYSNNEVIIRRGEYAPEGTSGNIAVAGAYNTTTTDAINNNTVKIYDGTFKGIIYGGYSTNGEVSGNTVNIYGGTLGVSPNPINIYGGYSNTNNVTGNVTNIEGGTFEYGAYIYGGASNDGSVTGNKLNIGNGTFSASDNNFYGGYSGSGNAKDNIVTIEGGTFNTGFKLYGGQPGSGKTSSGNILNLKTKIGGKATDVKYFQEMNFTLPADIADNGIMLTTASITYDNTKINVTAADGVSLKKDDKIYLVKADAKSGDVDTTNSTALGGAGVISLSENDLILTLLQDFEQKASGGDAATTKAIAEGIAASLAFVNQGADMVAGSGIDGLYVADSENPTIAAFSGNKTRYNTGSHVDIHGWNALAGVALNNKASFSHGVFVEIGNGDIDTYAALNGSGSSDYKGGGYMLRKDMGKGWTIDGAVRAGRVETSWGNDTKGGYEAKQTYYGAHVTFNKMLKEYGEQKLNGYLRYTFTHLGSDSVNLDGTHYGFDSVNSHRTRLGARMVEEGQNGFELYYGAAWEYGFGGDCDATVNGVTTSGPAVDGSNGVFEVGGTWSDNKWEISAGLEGYVGAKRGVAGGMNFIYKF